MAAPVPMERQQPQGRKMKDGYRALITFAAAPDIALWEKSVKPPGVEGGEKIPQTTMHNDEWRTFAARSLKELLDSGSTFAYDPELYDDIVALVNTETTVTVQFRNGATWAFFGYLKNFDPAALVEGTQPEGNGTIVATNVDPSSGDEAGPVYTAGSGTA